LTDNRHVVSALKRLDKSNVYLLDEFLAETRNFCDMTKKLDLDRLVTVAGREWKDKMERHGGHRRERSRSCNSNDVVYRNDEEMEETQTRRDRERQSRKPTRYGPNERRLERVLARHNYELEVRRGVRIVRPRYNLNNSIIDATKANNGVVDETNRFAKECLVDNLPKTLFEDELLELLEPFAPILVLELYTDEETGATRGYACVTFMSREMAELAVKKVLLLYIPSFMYI
jgi:RNA recognition motif-containing protein